MTHEKLSKYPVSIPKGATSICSGCQYFANYSRYLLEGKKDVSDPFEPTPKSRYAKAWKKLPKDCGLRFDGKYQSVLAKFLKGYDDGNSLVAPDELKIRLPDGTTQMMPYDDAIEKRFSLAIEEIREEMKKNHGIVTEVSPESPNFEEFTSRIRVKKCPVYIPEEKN